MATIAELEKQLEQLKEQIQKLKQEEEDRAKSISDPNELIKFLEKIQETEFLRQGEPEDDFPVELNEKCGHFTCVAAESTYNEGANQIETVYRFDDFNCFVKFIGYYTSYGGHEWEDCYLVTPKEYTAIEYIKI